MKTQNTLSDIEIMDIFKKALADTRKPDVQDIERSRRRKAKADFFNLDATSYCKFQEA